MCQACRDHVEGSRQTRGEFFCKACRDHVKGSRQTRGEFFAKPVETTSTEVDRHVEGFFCQACRDHVKGNRQTRGWFFAKPAETTSREVDRHVEGFLPSLQGPRRRKSTDTWRVCCHACRDHVKKSRQTRGEFFAKPVETTSKGSRQTRGKFFAKPVETTSREVDRHVESFFAKPVETTSKGSRQTRGEFFAKPVETTSREVDRHVESFLPSLQRPRQGKSTDTWRVCYQSCIDHVKGSRQTRGGFFAKPVETTSKEVDRHVEGFLPSL